MIPASLSWCGSPGNRLSNTGGYTYTTRQSLRSNAPPAYRAGTVKFTDE